MFPRPIEKSSAGVRLLYKLCLPIALFLWLLPLLAIFMTSIRPASDIAVGNVFGIPSSFQLIENYGEVFAKTDAIRYLINTLMIAIPTTIISVALACNFVPFQILMLPVVDMSNRLEIINTVPGLVMFHAAFQTGFCTLFMRNFIKALPHELIESARLEGVDEFKIFWHLVMPLVKPAIAALCVLIFTFIWNDFFWATVLLRDDSSLPITVGVPVPPVIMFFAMQKHFIAGLTLGATKG